MMKKRHILHWAMGVMMTPLLGSCAADDVVGDAGREGCDIILGQPMTVTSATRATDGRTSSTQFDPNEEVWLWANKADGSEYIKAWQLTAQSGGSLTGNSAKYWPSDGSSLDVYALHGNFKNDQITEGSKSWSSLSLTHTVETDQTSDNNKRLSDLLYSQTSSAVAPNTGSVQLTFDHELSKICIVLQKHSDSGIQDDDLKKATVQVSDIYPEVTYNTSTRAVTTSGTPTTITLGLETSGSTTYEAIVPSNMTINDLQVKITLKDFPETDKTRTFSCTLSSSVTFAKGNKYTFTLTLHNEIVVSSPAVSPWTPDEPTNMTIPQATVESS